MMSNFEAGVRRVWTCKVGGNVTSLPAGADSFMRRAVAAAFTDLTGQPVEFCFSGWGDDLDEAEVAVVEDRAPDPEVIRAALVKRLAALPDPSHGVTSMACDHPNPYTSEPLVPPWPGAVLSGLCDEDGVPTWLAQAGQVRGEQVRRRSDFVWVDNDQMVAHLDTVWVEVRAPRAVPEPETERVPWYRAMGRTLPYGELLGDIVQAYPSADSPGGIYVEYELPERNTTGNPHRDDADGTVEVLKDGES